ncbi:MAG TPA: MATE family efflux transporter [Luteolibacter sp.]|nr:MATE family efflux transporter [Luteolibacter sp.]
MSLLGESRQTLKLAFPMIIGQLGQMLLGVADTVMVARLGVTDLAALTFANALFLVPFIFGIGILTGVSVLTANARGARDAAGTRASCRHGLYLALAIGLLVAVIGWVLSSHLSGFGQPPEVAERGKIFFRIIMISAIPGLAAIALKNHVDALNRPWTPFWISLGGVLLNILLNWILIYGKLGFPACGLDGAAIATLIARCAIVATMFLWLRRDKHLREWVPERWFAKPVIPELRKLLSIGFPASLNLMWEVGTFSAAGLLVGLFGKNAMAAHQIALTCTSTSFMVSLGLSMALTVRIGRAKGAEEHHRLRSIAISGWMLAGLFSLIAIACFTLFGPHITGWFISEPEVVEITTALLVIVGFYQMPDALQVASAGMLRGLHDARIPAVMGFISYWIIGIPTGILLAFTAGWGVRGIWWGLAVGLTFAALTLGPRLWKRTLIPRQTP